MKTLRILLMFTITLFMYNCSDDDDDFKFDSNSLIQTKWNGTFTESYNRDGAKITRNASVGLIFNTDSQGEYSVKYETDIDPTTTTFNYKINNKMLIMQEGLTLGGNWLLISIDEKNMKLEKGTSGEDSYEATMTLTRVR